MASQFRCTSKSVDLLQYHIEQVPHQGEWRTDSLGGKQEDLQRSGHNSGLG
jgi:hypothetical protein